MLDGLKKIKIIQWTISSQNFIKKETKNMFKQYLNTNYDIYDDGRCYSHKSNKFLTPKMSLKYPTYNLTIQGKKKSVKIHRMVAETFLP
jgi:hypothetical protein